MLERKRIDHSVRYIPSGIHPLAVRAAGFPGWTVPALKIDGRRIQGSREIAAALEELEPEPALFPATRREAVRAAEAWGEREFQPLPRRLFRWGTKNSAALRRWITCDVEGIPLPGPVASATAKPVGALFARLSRADDAAVRADIANLPTMLDHVARLMEEGTIGGAEPNAADFQIGTTARALLAFEDLRPLVEGTPAGRLGMQVFPDYRYTVPRFLPDAWVARG